ncbi:MULTISPECIES: GNAT family N-acetyltransferase [unclassified Bacillus (in: firmicutes)]|uniref:GNAT family N-acetyltransferase n=1 Tax=unclassified Bacillus (in: firmicutes) TaxID=185979 RepID=UPI0008F4392A|nr:MULTISPECIES: GNAT family N-acetyltransferase [unclassified Bacillus (in: firmicutes)]SFA86625.1 aminoglycoside 6'-N-acetyltransferase [Bacillus sp. UNCCL13]SFQ83777.1 aminoglycoside 6'-N-acetyltransferase [Bacillus sp. cl95]
MVFQIGPLRIRKLEEKDNVVLARWLSDPAVLEYYEGRDNPFNLEKVNEIFYSADDDEVRCMVEFDGVMIGYIQFYLIDDETKKVYGYADDNIYGTDQFIGEVDYWNKGIGTLLVTLMVNYLTDHKNADRVVLDPQIRNKRAIRCYEKCGFKKVKILSKRELHEGEYQDCWLMEYKNDLVLGH